MLNIPLNRTYTLAPILVSVLLLAVFLLPEAWLFQLTYERPHIQAGQWWRLLTGQFVHLSWGHVAINIAGIWVMYLLYAEHAAGWRYIAVVALLALASNLGMYWFAENITYYVGFSGVLYGLFAWGALRDVQQRIKLGWLLLVGIVAKVTWEYCYGPVSIGPATADDLAVAAHFYGVVGGLLVAITSWLVQKLRKFHS
ncbi:MAG: rhombosortase [Idiomarina sp.]|nr:rhombosortase [Idiomarina sp.]